MTMNLLIDIDNTIYSSNTGLQLKVLEFAKLFLQKHTLMVKEESDLHAIRLYNEYGSIFSGLIKEYSIDPEEFIKFVFQFDVGEFLKPDPDLAYSLISISENKYAFSDSPEEYIKKILTSLGLVECFSGIYGRRFFNFNSKCEYSSLTKLFLELKIRPEDCILVDDKLENISVAKNIGMSTIWVNENHSVQNEEVDFVITNIHDINKISIFNENHFAS